MNQGGTAIVGWIRGDEEVVYGDTTRLDSAWVSFYTPGAGWSTAERVDGGSPEKGYLDVGIDADGNAMAVWMGWGVEAAYYRPSSGWAAPDEVGVSYPSFAMAAGGSAIVLWLDDGADPYADDLWSRRFTPLEGWGNKVLVQAATQLTDSPDLVLDAAGDAMMAGLTQDADAHVIWSSSAGTDLAWSATLETPAQPSLTMDGEGNALALWVLSAGLGWRSSYYTAEAGWGDTEIVDAATPDDTVTLTAMGIEGDAIALLRRTVVIEDKKMHEMWSTSYAPDSGWSDAVKISSAVGLVEWSTVAVGSAGDAIAVWAQDDLGNGVHTAWTNRYTPGVGWKDPEPVDATPPMDARPDLVIDAEGNAIAVWSRGGWTTPEQANWHYWISSPSD